MPGQAFVAWLIVMVGPRQFADRKAQARANGSEACPRIRFQCEAEDHVTARLKLPAQDAQPCLSPGSGGDGAVHRTGKQDVIEALRLVGEVEKTGLVETCRHTGLGGTSLCAHDRHEACVDAYDPQASACQGYGFASPAGSHDEHGAGSDLVAFNHCNFPWLKGFVPDVVDERFFFIDGLIIVNDAIAVIGRGKQRREEPAEEAG